MSDFKNSILQEIKDNDWNIGNQLMSKIISLGSELYFSAQNIKDFDKAFHEKGRKDSVCCMDEGTAQINNPEVAIMGMGGSGILFPASSREDRLKRVSNLYLKLGIREITSHDGCGAANIAWKAAGEKSGTGFDDPDEYGKKWSNDLQSMMQEISKEKIKFRHIASDEIVRKMEYHNARSVWFDATGRFNPDKLEKPENEKQVLPKGFLIDYGNVVTFAENDVEKNYPFDELKIALEIAFGHHGFNNKFTKENPFTIFIPAESKEQLVKIKKEVEQFVDRFDFEDRVIVDGFVF